ncbi:MAG: hypothetical protein R3Y12_00145 [Clostridia bacterium]
MTVNGNNAYKSYENIQEHKEFVNQMKLVEKITTKGKINMLFLCNVALVAFMAVCAFSLIYGYTNVTLLTKEIQILESEIDVLASQGVSLNARIDQMFNLEDVEVYAINNLSMIKLDQNQIEQIHIQNPDTIEIYNNVSVVDLAILYMKNIFVSIWEYIN